MTYEEKPGKLAAALEYLADGVLLMAIAAGLVMVASVLLAAITLAAPFILVAWLSGGAWTGSKDRSTIPAEGDPSCRTKKNPESPPN